MIYAQCAGLLEVVYVAQLLLLLLLTTGQQSFTRIALEWQQVQLVLMIVMGNSVWPAFAGHAVDKMAGASGLKCFGPSNEF